MSASSVMAKGLHRLVVSDRRIHRVPDDVDRAGGCRLGWFRLRGSVAALQAAKADFAFIASTSRTGKRLIWTQS
jgi:hypothetical protein